MPITRNLSPIEDFFRVRNVVGFYRNFQVTATYSQAVTPELLFKALRKTVLDYHILVCTVTQDNDSTDHSYEPLQKLTFGQLVENYDPEVYLTNGVINEKFMKRATELQFRFNRTDPLFKVILVGAHTVCAVFEHTIADGVVGNYFHEILLENLAYFDDTTQSEYGEYLGPETVIFDSLKDIHRLKNSLPPPIDMFLPQPRAATLPSNDAAEGSPKLSKWPGRFANTKQFTLAFKLVHFTPEQTQQILAKCREHKVTLTPYIEAVLAVSLQPIFSKDHYASFRVAMALRRFIDATKASPEYHQILNNPSYKIMGTSAHMGWQERIPPLTQFSWELVQNMNRHLLEYIEHPNALDSYHSYLQASDKGAFFENTMSGPKADTAKISNLGYLDIPVYNPGPRPWTISNMVFSQDVSPTTADFMLNIISTKLGGLNLVLTYFDHTFEDFESQNFDDIVKQFHANILKYSGAA